MEDVKSTMTNTEWEEYVKGEVLVFMMKHNLNKLTVDDGSGKKGVIRRNAAGEYKIQTTCSETL